CALPIFNADGSLDTNFNSFVGIALTNRLTDQNGNSFWATLKAVAVQLDGKILLGGTFDAVNGIGRTNLARLNTDGSLDPSFSAGTELTDQFTDQYGNPIVKAASVSALALQPDGNVILGGEFLTVNGAERTSIARLSQNGSLD